MSPFREFNEKIFNLWLKYKSEGNEITQKLVKLTINSLYDENIRKDITEECNCKSESWMSTEYDSRVSGYWRFPNKKCLVELKQDDGLECESESKNHIASSLR